MRLVDNFKLWLIARRRRADRRYGKVLREIHRGEFHDDLLAKSLSESDGSLSKAFARYIRHRVDRVRDEEEVGRQEVERLDEAASSTKNAVVIETVTDNRRSARLDTKSLVIRDPEEPYLVATICLTAALFAGVFVADFAGFIPNVFVSVGFFAFAGALSASPIVYYRWRRWRARCRFNAKYDAFANRHRTNQ
jgi:hypothetical protein